MAEPVAVTPTSVSGDLARILALEQRPVAETGADLSAEQRGWRPTPTARSARDILWHLAYATEPTYPASKAAVFAALGAQHTALQQAIATPGKLEEPVRWWTGDMIPYRGVIWA